MLNLKFLGKYRFHSEFEIAIFRLIDLVIFVKFSGKLLKLT